MTTEAELDALARECEIEFFTGGGPGGQHRNKTESAVRVRHIPTGIVVVATERRSQHQNREAALGRLAARLAALRKKRKPRKKTRPSKAAKARRVEAKKKVGAKKALRARPRADD